MRLAKAPVAIGLTAALILGGGIVALASNDSEPAHQAARPAATPAPSSPTSCGTNTAVELARVAGQVAERIYAAEEHSAATVQDHNQIAGYGPLLSAVRQRNQAAVRAAVRQLVFSHTHIVRLRVSSGARLWADIGGPYILAPVRGFLRAGGRTIGRFVFSVQDDLGYIKLVTRFIGVPLVLRTPGGQVPVPGQASPGPARIPDRGAVSYHGASYQAYSFEAAAYPQGPLRVSLLVGQPPGLAALSCPEVAAAQTANVARRIARRFALSPATVPVYARLVHALTQSLVYIHAGGHSYAVGTRRVPSGIPSSGAVRLGGRTYTVASFKLPTSAGQARVQLLVGG